MTEQPIKFWSIGGRTNDQEDERDDQADFDPRTHHEEEEHHFSQK